jgi:aminodeoxyfutalosine deaminase
MATAQARTDKTLRAFLVALPKVELHVHLVGSASVSTLVTLAGRHPEVGVPTERRALERWLQFSDFAHFGRVYGTVSRLITDGTVIVELVDRLAAELAANNVRYAEVTVTPLTHLEAMSAADLAEALRLGRIGARRAHRVELGWIFDVSGELGAHAAQDTLRWVIGHGPDGTLGFGVGGPEQQAPRALFKDCFAQAAAIGLHSVPHAGETVGPRSVWSALIDLGAERIGHGIRSVEDPRLVEHLAASGTALEVCPTSNLRTGAVAALEDHPLPALLDAGVPITLGTDDPGMFGTDLSCEYWLCHEVFGLSLQQLVEIALTGVRSAFCAPELAQRIRGEILQLVNGDQGAAGSAADAHRSAGAET